jgi:hypothetical protein
MLAFTDVAIETSLKTSAEFASEELQRVGMNAQRLVV